MLWIVVVWDVTLDEWFLMFLRNVLLVSGASSPSGPGPPHSRGFQITHNITSQSVVLLWKSDQLITETSTGQHITPTTDKHPFPRWDLNPQSQWVSGRRPTPQTARPLGLAFEGIQCLNIWVLSPTRMTALHLQMNAPYLFKMLGTARPVTERHIPVGLNLFRHHCVYLISQSVTFISRCSGTRSMC